jgi:hypothetical protein
VVPLYEDSPHFLGSDLPLQLLAPVFLLFYQPGSQ